MPLLDAAALKTRIASGALDPLYLFVGDDFKLIDRMVAAIEHTIDPADRPFAIDRFHAGDDNASPAAIVAAARGLPMLGDRRIVVVLRAERLLKPKRAQKATDDDAEESEAEESLDLRPLEEYVQSPSSDSVLVLVAADIDRSRRLTKRVVEKAMVVQFAGLALDAVSRDPRAGASAWIKDELVRAGRAIDADAARTLANRAGQDMTKLRADMERLLLFTEGRSRIVLDDVLEVTADSQAVDDDWAIVNAIAAGDAPKALVETAKRLDRGDSPHAIVGQLRWWVSARLSEADPRRVKSAIEALMQTDLALKRSGDERMLLELAVLALAGR